MSTIRPNDPRHGFEQWLDAQMDKVKKNPLTTLLVIICGILALPWLLTREEISFVDFKQTGPIGDTIGGISGPMIGIISALLVYYSFRQQIRANELVTEQRNDDRKYDNAMFLYTQLEKRIERYKSNDPALANLPEGAVSLMVSAQMMFNDFPALTGVAKHASQETILRHHEKIKTRMNLSPTLNVLNSLTIQIDHYLITIRRSYEIPDDRQSMETLGYFIDLYAFIHQDYLMNPFNYLIREYAQKNYEEIEPNLLSSVIRRIEVIRQLILEFSSAGQFAR